MKIALLTEKYTPDIGGLAISSERFARLLSSAGHKIRVFAPTLSLPPSDKQALSPSGVSVTRFGANKRVDDTLVDWFELVVEEHKREPFDVLHAYFLTQAGFVATYAGKYLNIPSVVSIRGNDIERASFDPSKFSHAMYALQHAIAVTTNATELAMKAKAFFDREIILIPNGVDTEHFRPMDKNVDLASNLGLGEHPVIGFVGELRKKKGLAAFLSAYAQVNKIHSTSMLIVGEIRQGEDKQHFDEFRSTNPQLPITVTGHISHNDLPSYFSLIDIFSLPSLRDGMPNAILEAMACEKAVVATEVGGVSDVIKDGKNGSIVSVNDADSLSRAIIELLENTSLRKKLGECARQKIVKDFTLEKELGGNLDVYRQLGLKA
ncbi:MAG TPA: glycosyltransferase [Anaerolineales bacterium]